MGRKIFIIAGLLVAVIIVGIMAFVQPKREQQERLVSPGQFAAGHTPDTGAMILAPDMATPDMATPLAALVTPAATMPPADPLPSPTPGPHTPSPTPATTPGPTAPPTPSPTPNPTPSAAPRIQGTPLSGIVIGLDPGHQKKSNNELEPVAPGSSEMKKKVSSGTYGRFSGVPEHEVVLAVGLYLRDMLKEAGATVIMTRETADVNISNVQRAQLFNEHNVALGLRLHCNGSNDANVDGAFMLIPKSNPYKADCELSAKLVLESYGKATGIGIKKGITVRSDQTGFNWCERPIINIEMGHMTNKTEDYKLTDKSFQKSMAQGLFDGIVRYFEQK